MEKTTSKKSVFSLPAEIEQVGKEVVDAAYCVHCTLGPGLLEHIYEACLCYELEQRNLKVEKQVAVPLVYGKLTVEGGLRLDLLVENCVVVEIKAVETLLPIHQAQLLTYLKLSGKRLGFLINFNTLRIKDGIKRRAM